jgi:hypothetical protein
MEQGALNEAFIDAAVAGRSETLVDAGRGERAQPPYRRQSAFYIRCFELVLHPR